MVEFTISFLCFFSAFPADLPQIKKKTNKRRKEVRKGLVREKHFSFLI